MKVQEEEMKRNSISNELMTIELLRILNSMRYYCVAKFSETHKKRKEIITRMKTYKPRRVRLRIQELILVDPTT